MGDLNTALTVLLTLLYTALCSAALVQIGRIFYYRHKIKSFQFTFLVILSLWALLRVVFFGETEDIPGAVTLVLLWFPGDLQFSTLSLLVVFFAFISYNAEARKRRLVLYVYVTVNVFMFALTSIFIAASCGHGDCTISESLRRGHHTYMAVQLLLLIVVYAVYAYKLATISHKQMPYAYSLAGSEASSSDFSPSRLQLIVTVFFVVFVSRCVYDFLVVFQVYVITIGNVDGGIKQVDFAAFTLLMLWEIVPTLIILHYFRHIPETQVPRSWRHFLCCCCCCVDSPQQYRIQSTDSLNVTEQMVYGTWSESTDDHLQSPPENQLGAAGVDGDMSPGTSTYWDISSPYSTPRGFPGPLAHAVSDDNANIFTDTQYDTDDEQDAQAQLGRGRQHYQQHPHQRQGAPDPSPQPPNSGWWPNKSNQAQPAGNTQRPAYSNSVTPQQSRDVSYSVSPMSPVI